MLVYKYINTSFAIKFYRSNDLFCSIDLTLELPINVRRYFDSRMVRNSVIFINREILPCPENALICFPFLTTQTYFSVFY